MLEYFVLLALHSSTLECKNLYKLNNLSILEKNIEIICSLNSHTEKCLL